MIESLKQNKERAIRNDPSILADLPNCHEEIAEIAYFRAESRGFEPGHDLDDWFTAERYYKQGMLQYKQVILAQQVEL